MILFYQLKTVSNIILQNKLKLRISKKMPPENCEKGNIRALDSVDHNPSSTSAEGSFHSTGISIMQALEFKNEGEDRILPFEIVSANKKIELPDKFTVVKGVYVNQEALEVPLKSIQKRKVNINDKLAKETEWLDSNILNLSNDYEKGKKIS